MPNKAAEDKRQHLLTIENKKAIRKAWKRGRRVIMLDGDVYTLSLQKRQPRFSVGGEITTQEEKWIIIRRSDHLVPIASIELEDQGNLRSKT